MINLKNLIQKCYEKDKKKYSFWKYFTTINEFSYKVGFLSGMIYAYTKWNNEIKKQLGEDKK